VLEEGYLSDSSASSNKEEVEASNKYAILAAASLASLAYLADVDNELDIALAFAPKVQKAGKARRQ